MNMYVREVLNGQKNNKKTMNMHIMPLSWLLTRPVYDKYVQYSVLYAYCTVLLHFVYWPFVNKINLNNSK